MNKIGIEKLKVRCNMTAFRLTKLIGRKKIFEKFYTELGPAVAAAEKDYGKHIQWRVFIEDWLLSYEENGVKYRITEHDEIVRTDENIVKVPKMNNIPPCL